MSPELSILTGYDDTITIWKMLIIIFVVRGNKPHYSKPVFWEVEDKKLIIFKHGSFVYFYLSDDKSFYYIASFQVTNIKYKENYGMRTSREFTQRSHQIERMVSPIEIFKVYECVFLPYFEYDCHRNLASQCLNFFFCKNEHNITCVYYRTFDKHVPCATY